jgi:hypothetical protein
MRAEQARGNRGRIVGHEEIAGAKGGIEVVPIPAPDHDPGMHYEELATRPRP